MAYQVQASKKTVSNYIGQSKNRHIIRPRNVDLNKKLLVTIEREDSTTEMQIPRVPNIEVPKIETVVDYKSGLKYFQPPDFYYKHLTLPTNSLENILPYEINEEDLILIETLKTAKKIPASLLNEKIFEETFELWEKDTGRDQIIPSVRAFYLTKEKKVCEKWESAENANSVEVILQALFEHWVKQREKMGRPLLRRFWKSEGISDSQLKIAFQPRGGYREKMRLRNSKKNDYDSYEKVFFT